MSLEKVDPNEGDSAYSYEVHNYVKDPQSGAGNCQVCARPQDNKRHPHEFNKARNFPFCVCTLPRSSLVHQMTRV